MGEDNHLETWPGEFSLRAPRSGFCFPDQTSILSCFFACDKNDFLPLKMVFFSWWIVATISHSRLE
jgi:hypothetical protein